MEFYGQMIDQMQGTDFDVQWRHGGHPSPAFLRESLDAGYLYVGVLEGEGIVCAMVVNNNRKAWRG